MLIQNMESGVEDAIRGTETNLEGVHQVGQAWSKNPVWERGRVFEALINEAAGGREGCEQ